MDLPPLHFLPAFEAAGRLGSIKAAAAQLHITPSAVSQQLKVLEDALRTPLFERRGATIKLTPAGAIYLEEIRGALADIARASERMRSHARVLRLSTADFIACEFLLPRLTDFRATFPGVELSLQTTTRVVDFHTDAVDVAIRIGDGPWPGLVAHVLGSGYVTPVCSQAQAAAIRNGAELRAQTLIELRGQERRGFHQFMQRHDEQGPPKVLTFHNYIETMRAAEQGLGVALGLFPMTSHWVLEGRLAVPLPVRLPLAAKICFVHRTRDAGDPLYARLTLWLREQYAALPALPAGRLVQKGARPKHSAPARVRA